MPSDTRSVEELHRSALYGINVSDEVAEYGDLEYARTALAELAQRAEEEEKWRSEAHRLAERCAVLEREHKAAEMYDCALNAPTHVQATEYLKAIHHARNRWLAAHEAAITQDSEQDNSTEADV